MLANRMIEAAALLLVLGLTVACSGAEVGDDPGGQYGPNDPNGGSTGGSGDAGPRDPIVRDGGASDTRALYQAKSAAQLAASLTQCVGAGKTTILADMLQATPPPVCFPGAEPGACAFLTAGLYKKDQDIIASQTRTFDGAESATRQGTRPDQLGVEVLTALQAVAGVAASSCLRGSDELCACATHDQAAAMLARCLPNFDPQSPAYQSAVAGLEAKCAVAPGAAVASLLASYAFLRVN